MVTDADRATASTQNGVTLVECGCCGLLFGPTSLRLHRKELPPAAAAVTTTAAVTGSVSQRTTATSPIPQLLQTTVSTPSYTRHSTTSRHDLHHGTAAAPPAALLMMNDADDIPIVESFVFSGASSGRFERNAGQPTSSIRRRASSPPRLMAARPGPPIPTDSIVSYTVDVAKRGIASGNVVAVPLASVHSLTSSLITVASSSNDLQRRRRTPKNVTDTVST